MAYNSVTHKLQKEVLVATKLTLFYDGGCPLCVKEMKHLKAKDKQQNLKFENIWAVDFAERYPHIEVAEANRILHGQKANGEMIYGLDVTHAAWSAVGRGWMTAMLRWPIVKWFADKGYLFFARNRNGISKLITGQERCLQCSLDE